MPRPFRARGRTEPLLDFDWDDPWTWGWALFLAAAVVGVLAKLFGAF